MRVASMRDMDSFDNNRDEGGSFLLECVSDTMSAHEAADSTLACWTEAEQALAPVIGREGLGVVFRHGEAVAERWLGLDTPVAPRSSIDAFCDWVRALPTDKAVNACKGFLVSVEQCLESLLGANGLRRLLRRGGNPASSTRRGL